MFSLALATLWLDPSGIVIRRCGGVCVCVCVYGGDVLCMRSFSSSYQPIWQALQVFTSSADSCLTSLAPAMRSLLKLVPCAMCGPSNSDTHTHTTLQPHIHIRRTKTGRLFPLPSLAFLMFPIQVLFSRPHSAGADTKTTCQEGHPVSHTHDEHTQDSTWKFDFILREDKVKFLVHGNMKSWGY